MTNGLVQHITTEESTSLQWIKIEKPLYVLSPQVKDTKSPLFHTSDLRLRSGNRALMHLSHLALIIYLFFSLLSLPGSLGGDGLKHNYNNGISVFGKPDVKFNLNEPSAEQNGKFFSIFSFQNTG